MYLARAIRHSRASHWITTAIVSVACILATTPAYALIEGGVGNEPIKGRGWPAGAEVIVNHTDRVAYWVGPPFGGGQWHTEYNKSDAKTISTVLAIFAKLEIKNKRVVVHDGIGQSFWLNMNNDPAKAEAARIDWSFMVWEKDSWERLLKRPADHRRSIDAADAKRGPPSQIDIYTGGNIKWKDVIVPKELKIVDNRLEAHGFTLADGVVYEGEVVDPDTRKPVAAHVRLERVEPRKTGGYEYITVAEATANERGRWVIKKAPAGWLRLVVSAEGYISRVAGYTRFDDQPRWSQHDCDLLCPAPVSGVVTDDAGKPLADVDVSFGNVVTSLGGGYDSAEESKVKTDKKGRFRTSSLPAGKATIWVHKPGYVRPGLGPAITMPSKDIKLEMTRSASVAVTVDFSKTKRPDGYIVNIEDENGGKVGSWGGSGNIDANNQITFKDMPPGKYTLFGRPNPGSEAETTEKVTIDAKGGKETKLTLMAK
jgi:hypothetical protein